MLEVYNRFQGYLHDLLSSPARARAYLWFAVERATNSSRFFTHCPILFPLESLHESLEQTAKSPASNIFSMLSRFGCLVVECADPLPASFITQKQGAAWASTSDDAAVLSAKMHFIQPAVPGRPAITEVQTETVHTTDELFKIARQVDLQIDYAVNTVSNIGLVFHFHS